MASPRNHSFPKTSVIHDNAFWTPDIIHYAIGCYYKNNNVLQFFKY